MAVTEQPADPPRERSTTLGIWEIIRQHAVHVAVFVIILAVFLAGRTDFWQKAPRINLPSTQAHVVVSTPTTVVDEEQYVPTLEPEILTDNVIHPQAIPHTYEPRLPSHHFEEYLVEKGDTPNKVAELFNIEPATLLWGNPDLSKEAQLLRVGITLTILPIDGVLHTVDVSDTVESLAELYAVEPQAIIDYADNNLQQSPHRPVPGTQLIIPGGEKTYLVWTYSPNTPRGQAVAASFYDGSVVYSGIGRFVWPAWARLSQYYWWGHRAIDIATPTGTPILASDSGTVIYAGWNTWGYGNLVVLDHGNGFQTWYAHLDSIWVANGQFVSQGAAVAASGNTGNSSGPHLHFEIRYNGMLLNPLDYLP